MRTGLLESLPRLEVSAPLRIERVSIRLQLDVPPDGSLAGINQPSFPRRRPLRILTSGCSEAPPSPSKPMPVPFYDPGVGLVWMAELRPSPEQVPEDHSCFPVRRRRRDVTVIVCPAANDWVEQPYQALLIRAAILTNDTTYLLQKSVHVFLGRCDQELAVVLA
jgi:hypothetical protein